MAVVKTSKITLYKDCKILPEKNFYVEDIENYLSTLTTDVRDGFQYQKLELNMTIKFDLQQEDIDENWNYLKIEQDGNTSYYFILQKHWISKETVSFDISIDTLNTYRIGTDYDFSAKTKIIRQHKDRLKKEDGERLIFPEITSIDNNVWYYMRDDRNNTPLPQTDYYYEDSFVPVSRKRMQVQLRDENYNVIWDSEKDLVLGHLGYIKKINFSVDNQKISLVLYDDSIPISWPITMSANIFVKFAAFVGTNDTTYIIPQGVLQRNYSRIIDEQSEGLNPLLLGHDALEINDEDEKWYLIYKTTNAMASSTDNIPVEVLLCGERERTIDVISANATITPEDLNGTNWYLFSFGVRSSYNSIPEIQDGTRSFSTQFIADGTAYDIGVYPINEDRGKYRQKVVKFRKTISNTIHWEIWLLSRFNIQIAGTKIEGEANSISFKQGTVNIAIGPNVGINVVDWENVNITGEHTFSGTFETKVIKTISSVNKSDNKLLNIIEVPYCPVNDLTQLYYDTATELLTFNSGGSKDLFSIKLVSNKSIDTEDKYNPFNIFVPNVVVSTSSLRNDDNESKLYHSDFYQCRFVYDSNAFTFLNEYYNGEKVWRDTFDFDLAVSSHGKSNIAFIFPQYSTNKRSENYEVLCANRNNNLAIYNSNYFNYLKIGYGEDTKNKNAQLTKNIATTGLTTIGAAISFATTPYTGGAGIAAGISLAATTAATLTNLIYTDAQAERSIAQKLNEAKNQAASISGSDDLDIFNFYANNKAKLMVWECSDIMKDKIADLFFYCGYNCNYQGIPDISSRYRFNFLQCELELTNSNVPDDRKADLKLRYQAGITVLHNHSGWDWEQEYENWENSLF